MPEVYAVGGREAVAPLKVLGAELLPGFTAQEVSEALARVGEDPEAVLVLVTEQAAALAPEAVTALRERLGPTVLVIPSHRGATNRALREMRDLVARAVGIDLLSGGAAASAPPAPAGDGEGDGRSDAN